MSSFNGPAPDCVHCRFMARQPDGEYRCRQHDMTLHTPIRIFCRHLTPPADLSDDYEQWFDATVKTQSLSANTLYTWVETTTIDPQGKTETHLDGEAIALLTSYITWSAGTFWEVVRQVREEKRESYRKHGYDIKD